MVIFDAGRRARGTLPRRETRICWTMLSSAHQRFDASMSRAEEDIVKTGCGEGARSGRVGSTKVEGSRIWPSKLLARIREFTPSSQAKKSCFELRIVMWVTVGKVLEGEGGVDERIGTGGIGYKGGTGGI